MLMSIDALIVYDVNEKCTCDFDFCFKGCVSLMLSDVIYE
jgi:hypothetical protein